MKKILALLVAVLLIVASMSVAFAAETNNHTITITNANATGKHEYTAYQVFSGNLDATEGTLSDIAWGNGVNGTALLAALKADTFANHTDFAACTTAEDVAKVLAGYGDNSAKLDAVARVIGDHLGTAAGASTQDGTPYTINVSGDGYYFIKDTTANLAAGDTYSKFMLNVVKDVSVAAKDTVIAPDKNILIAQGEDPAQFQRVKADSAQIGDTVTFEVQIDVPDTTQYKDHFVFVMHDQLPAGLTLTGISSVKVGNDNVNYTMTVKDGDEYKAYTAPTDAVTAAGGQDIKIVFPGFKAFAETAGKNYIGQKMVITYTAVVNDDAVYGETGNENEVYFDYSNNPNHDYHGDDFGPDEPKGETPHSKTITHVTTLEIIKVDGGNNNNPLAGAEFTITGTQYNTTLVTGERFVAAADGDYWALLDGSYTTTNPETPNMNTTQYVTPYARYNKEEYTDTVVVPEDVTITAISNSQGKITIKGLKEGTYTITETKAPDGYNKLEDSYELHIGWDRAAALNKDNVSGGFSIDQASKDAGFTMTDDGVKFSITLQNFSGQTLPSTGGMGTTILYIAGSVLVLAAAILLITKRRMNAND